MGRILEPELLAREQTRSAAKQPLSRAEVDAYGFPPSSNLGAQSLVIANSLGFIGTYGGLAYLAGAYGVPSAALWSDDRGLRGAHEVVGRLAAQAMGVSLELVSSTDLEARLDESCLPATLWPEMEPRAALARGQ